MHANDIFMILIALIMCGICFFLLTKDTKEYDKKLIIYSIIMVVVVVGITITLQLVYTDNTFLFNLKRVCLLSLLWPVAYTDFKEYRIPNEFIIFGLICRGIIIPFELIFAGDMVWHLLLSEVIAAMALVLASFLCKLCIKNSVGAGDIKLFVVMGLMLSLDGIWSAIFMTLIISFFISVFVLISKRKTRKDTIPFGPSIALGTYISIFLTGM